MTEPKNKIEGVKVVKKGEKLPKHPLYDAFTFQLSAAVLLARKIASEKDFAAPMSVERFLNEFGRKAA